MPHFPDYIWDPNTKELYVSDTNTPFIHSGEFLEGPMKFSSKEQVKRFLQENNLTGTLGVRLR